MVVLNYLAKHKLYTSGVSLALVALLGLGVTLVLGGLRNQPPQLAVTSETTYTPRREEDVRKIAGRYGLSPSVIMTENGLKSFQINLGQELVIRPVTDFRRIPDEIGSQIYGKIHPSLIYEDAFVFPDKKGTLKTVVLFSDDSYSTNVEIGGGAHELIYGVPEQTVTKRLSKLTLAVLDQRDKKILAYPFNGTYFGRDTMLYPLGYAQDGTFRFILHWKRQKDWFPWQSRDMEGAAVMTLNSSKDDNIEIGTIQSSKILGRTMRIEDRDGDGLIEIIGTYFGSDDRTITAGSAGKAVRKGVVIKRFEFSQGDIVEDITSESAVGELVRLFSSRQLTAEDLLLIAESDPKTNGSNIRREHVNDALRILQTAQRRKADLIGVIGESSGTNYLPKVASILGTNDYYILRQVLNSEVQPYLFFANEQREIKPLTLELYSQKRAIYGIIPIGVKAFGIFDPQTRELAAQGKVSLGREGALEINLGATKTIVESQAVSTNFAIVPSKKVADKTRGITEKARRGEIPVSEALQLAGSFADLSSPVTTLANTITTANNTVDFLRAQGYNSAWEVLSDAKKLSSGDLEQIRQIHGFQNLMGELYGEKKK